MRNFFGTDGIRGRMGTGLFVQEQLIQLGKAIALWAQKKYSKKKPHILIFHDTRISVSFVKAALKTGLLQYTVTLEDGGVLPTPAAAHLMKIRPEIDCALIISASHNPFQDNGIKIIDAQTGKLTRTDEEAISYILQDTSNAISQNYGYDTSYNEAQTLYCSIISALFPENFLRGKRIVLDTAHGATCDVAPLIFKQLGAEVIVLHNNPTGYNINESCGALHTQTIAEAVKEYGAHAGFAFDGDGDRVIAINNNGEMKDGDDILTLLLTHSRYSSCTKIVGTIMTNEGFAQYLQKQNKELVRTPVGDKYIAEKLIEHNWILGGEPSGHIILHDTINTGDGILVALRLLETLCITHNWEMKTFERYPQVMINVPVAVRGDLEAAPLKNIIAHAQEHLTIGRILVRYSGTENVLRVMVETESSENAHAVCQQLAQELSQAL